MPRSPRQAVAYKPALAGPEHLSQEERCSFPTGVPAFQCVGPAARSPAFSSRPTNTDTTVRAQPQTSHAHICQEHLAGPPPLLLAAEHASLAAFKQESSILPRDAPLSPTVTFGGPAKPVRGDICHHHDQLLCRRYSLSDSKRGRGGWL